MKVLIIVESYFGCTHTIGQSIGQGLGGSAADTEVLAAHEAGRGILAGIDLLVVGAPTHNRGLPTATSRQMAANRGGVQVATGIREWLEQTQIPQSLQLAAFDTVTGRGWLNGSAAKQIVKLTGRGGAPMRSFLVTSGNALADGEAQAARAWGADLIRR